MVKKYSTPPKRSLEKKKWPQVFIGGKHIGGSDELSGHLTSALSLLPKWTYKNGAIKGRRFFLLQYPIQIKSHSENNTLNSYSNWALSLLRS